MAMMGDNSKKLTLVVPADLKFSPLVRHVSEDFFIYAGFLHEWTERLKLVVDELFMNAHLYGSKIGGTIYLSYVCNSDEVVFLIEDEGGDQSVNAETLQNIIRKNTAEMKDLTKTSGRGLAFFSHFWTDDLKIENSQRGGLAISFTKKITHELPPDPETQHHPILSAPLGAVTVVQLSGQIDAASMEEKIQPILMAIKGIEPKSTLALDCSDLTYINSTCVGYLASWVNLLHAKDCYLVLKHLTKPVRDVLQLVGLTTIIHLED